MLLKIIFFFLLSSQLFSQTILKSTYHINSVNIYINDILPNALENKLLYKIRNTKHSKRVKSKELISKLNALGFKDISAKSNYIKFNMKSPIDTTILKTFLKQHYLSKYKTLSIKKITVNPRGYIESIPEKYTVQIKNRSYLSQTGILNIKDIHNKKIFFNYNIDATIKILQTKQLIKRGESLSFNNTTFKVISLDKFRATPLMELKSNSIQTKRQVKIDKVLTVRDIENLDLVHKNSQVSVGFYNSGIYITFTAKALQNGKLGDIITIQKSDLKRLKAKVVGNKKVEMR